jgi:predicted type IV restriction endonuclease
VLTLTFKHIQGIALVRTKITSKRRIVAYAFAVSFSVLLVSAALQWIVYDDWLHETGPLRVIGSILASVVTFAFVLNWFRTERQRQIEAQRRFRIIAEMNDRIRNKVQLIACVRYAFDEKLTDDIRHAVEAIDAALNGVIADAGKTLDRPPSDPKPMSQAKSA